MFVKLDKPQFIGKEALVQQKAEGLKRKVVGIELNARAIPRHGYEVIDAESEEVVGEVTTGYCSISTGKSVCMAMVNIDQAVLGKPIKVKIHRKLQEGVVTKKRFYEKNYKK
jgi:aminomethyltransferase